MKNDFTYLIEDFNYQTKTIRELTETMIDIAIKGSKRSDSEYLLILYGVILDCAHKINRTMDNNTVQFKIREISGDDN